MKINSVIRFTRCWVAIALLAALANTAHAQKNVVQPGDPIIASSANMPGSEGVANAIDGTDAKYLNFDSKTGGQPSGFVVTPSVGVTWLTGIAMRSANDAPERDPLSITLEGSNDDTVTWTTGTWELVYQNDAIPAFANRFQTQAFSFTNLKAYKHYRWTILKTQADNTCCMQIAEVQLLGTTLPKNVVQPGDTIIASSANMPGSEGVANAIDGTDAKYLNFDSKTGGQPSGFVVSPSVGATVLSGLSMKSANDAPERDPLSITLEGSNDDTVTWTTGTWDLVYKNEAVPAFATRFQTQTFLFNNYRPYKHYRWTLLKTQADNTCCMQIAEVSLLGSGAPKNVIQPGDPIIASSANMPGSEGVANAIDGTDAKYLNFDSKTGGQPSGFVVTPSVGATAIIGLFMKSANDGPERDPLSITVEGSNDDTVTWTTGTWEVVYQNAAVPAFATRFETQTFYFPNQKSYKHYRWTVLKTQTDNTCCMQIAEVGLLAVTSQTDCSKASFLVQPVETPVLLGSQATFFTTVNGPWPLQWYANGTAIPGASGSSYTTPAATADLATNVYSVAIVGCETSSPVHAVIFTPSSTKSIGIHFVGGGANGAPTYINTDDIMGVQPQAYWINATNATGIIGDTTTLPDALNDSANATSPIIFEFATSGTWGAGTGSDTPTQRLLNGVVGGNTVGATQTFTFRSVPSGTHALLVYAVAPPLHYGTVSYTVGTQTYFVRVMNADEYKPAPGFYRGTSTDAKSPSIADFIRFDGVKADAAGDVVLTLTNLVATDRQVGLNALQLVLNAPSVGAPPAITMNPQPAVALSNGTATLTVQATGDNLTYQWRKNGRNLPNGAGVSGATTATLVISNFSAEDEAIYSVAIFNAAGSVSSGNATAYISAYDIKNALAGYWKFDETSGTSAANGVSGGKAAVVNGISSWKAGKVANSFSFDGSTYAQVDTYPKAVKALSVAGWVNVSSAVDGSGVAVAFARNGEGTLRSPGDGSSVPAGQFDLGLAVDTTDNSMRLWAEIQAGPNFPQVTAPDKFKFGSWQHVAFTADGAQMRLYLNGQQVGVTEYLSDLKTSTVDFLSIGARLNTNDVGIIVDDIPNYMFGQIDELAVWNRSLTADEVAKIYEAGSQGKALDTVVQTPPAANEPGKLTVSAAQGQVTVTWDKGTLQTAPAVTGPWTDSTAPSPVTEAAAAGEKFYRTKN